MDWNQSIWKLLKHTRNFHQRLWKNKTFYLLFFHLLLRNDDVMRWYGWQWWWWWWRKKRKEESKKIEMFIVRSLTNDIENQFLWDFWKKLFITFSIFHVLSVRFVFFHNLFSFCCSSFYLFILFFSFCCCCVMMLLFSHSKLNWNPPKIFPLSSFSALL